MRHKFVLYGIVLSVACLTAGCGGGDPGIKEYISNLKEAVDVMKTVKDEDSAKAANDKLKASGEKMETGAKAAKGWTDSQKKEALELGKQYDEQQKRITALGPNVDKACQEGTTKVMLGVAVISMMDAMQKEGGKK
jgi:hypothetical protein